MDRSYRFWGQQRRIAAANLTSSSGLAMAAVCCPSPFCIHSVSCWNPVRLDYVMCRLRFLMNNKWLEREKCENSIQFPQWLCGVDNTQTPENSLKKRNYVLMGHDCRLDRTPTIFIDETIRASISFVLIKLIHLAHTSCGHALAIGFPLREL